MKTFTINRKKWLRGGFNSKLRNGAGAQCCLGFYLRACGVPASYLGGIETPVDVPGELPAEAQWLSLKDGFSVRNSKETVELMNANDLDRSMPRWKREANIRRLFRTQGIIARFFN